MTREEAIHFAECLKKNWTINFADMEEFCDMAIEALSAADRPTTDCTKFLEWLKAEVLDEENWELNAVANGEVICRKFRKLGWLDVEDGYYVDTRPTGEWKEVYAETDYRNGWIEFSCECCEHQHGLESGEYGWSYGEPIPWKFCPMCGAKMRGEKNDKR